MISNWYNLQILIDRRTTNLIGLDFPNYTMLIEELGAQPSETIFDSLLRALTTISFEPVRGNGGFPKFFRRSVSNDEIARHHFFHSEGKTLNRRDAHAWPEQLAFIVDLEQREKEPTYRKPLMLVGIVEAQFQMGIDLHISNGFGNPCLWKFNRDSGLLSRWEVDQTTSSESAEHHFDFDFIGTQNGEDLRFFINLVTEIFSGNVSQVNIVPLESVNQYVYLLINTAYICGRDFFYDGQLNLKERDTTIITPSRNAFSIFNDVFEVCTACLFTNSNKWYLKESKMSSTSFLFFPFDLLLFSPRPDSLLLTFVFFPSRFRPICVSCPTTSADQKWESKRELGHELFSSSNKHCRSLS